MVTRTMSGRVAGGGVFVPRHDPEAEETESTKQSVHRGVTEHTEIRLMEITRPSRRWAFGSRL